MIDPHATREIESIIAYGTSTGVPMKVTSTIRPGAITGAGNLSFHAIGTAVDWGGPQPSVDSQALADIFHAFLPVEQHLAELIYAGPQVDFNIKNGKRVGKYAQSIHHNHCHVAVQRGVMLDELAPKFTALADIEQAPQDREVMEDMADPVDALAAPNGGVWVLTKDGGIRAYRGAPFFGAFGSLKPQNREIGPPFVALDPGAPDNPAAEGYTARGASGSFYHFDSGVLAAIQRGEI